MGTTFALRQSEGTSPVSSEVLKIKVRIGAISTASCFRFVVSLINTLSGQYKCVIFVFCVVFDCLLAPNGRWCCQTIFGPPDVARIMQLIGDGERFRAVAWRLDVSPSVVSRLLRSYQETGEYTRVKTVPGRQPQDKAVFLYCCFYAIT